VSTQWFVEPLDATTNRVIADLLGEDAQEAEVRGLDLPDDTRRNMWRVAFRTIAVLEASRRSLQLHFRVFAQRGPGSRRDKTHFVRTHMLKP
jgi:hypothetical protein